MATDPNQLLGGGGAPGVKFPEIGTTVRGIVRSARTTQQTDLSGVPKTWDDGNPMEQVEITLLTDDRDPENPADEGVRRLFVKGQMLGAINDAKGNADITTPGAEITVTYVGDKASSKKGFHAAKQYSATYKAAVGVAAGTFGDDEEPF